MIHLSADLFTNDTRYLFKRDKTNETIECFGISYYDHFINPYGYEIIILPFYTKSDLLDFLTKNNFLAIKRLYGNEPYLFVYKQPTIKNIVTKQYTLSIMTLFYSEQNKDLDIFYRYYIDQGVDHFFMYYNGEISDQKEFPTNPQVTYIEWNFRYWVQLDKSNKKHHAQIPAMVHFHKKYLPYCEYAMMIDTDEFVYCKSNTIKNYLIQNNIKHHLYTKHNWAKIDFSEGSVDFINDDPKRGKTIIYSDGFKINDAPYVHKLAQAQNSDIELFHNKKQNNTIHKYNQHINIKKICIQ